MTDNWDAKLNTWVLGWDYWQTFHDPVNLFHANIFYPARYSLAFSENLYGIALLGFPLFAAGASPITVYNVLLLLGMWLSAVSAWALARYVTDDAVASVVAGIVYAFVPWRIAQISHFQFQWSAFLALLLLFLLRYLDADDRRDVFLFGLFFAWNGLSNVHYALFAGLLVLSVVVHECVTRGLRAAGARGMRCVLAVAAASVVLLPFYLPYRRAAALYGIERSAEEVGFYSAGLLDFSRVGSQNKLYGPLSKKWHESGEALFPGFTALLLAGAAFAGKGAGSTVAWNLPAKRRALARILDAILFGGVVLWALALVVPRFVLGPLKLRDPGRILVFLTLLLFVRLAVSFPRRARFANLGQFLEAFGRGKRCVLYLGVAILGMLVALGANTPYYRFLHQSAGPLFRSIRVPARGIVLFHVALAVLAALGLARIRLLTRRATARRAWTAAAVLLMVLEYRAFPVIVFWMDGSPAPTYRWLKDVRGAGAVIEWPFGLDYDVEYVFRSTAHFRSLVNGYSGFFPKHYDELNALFEQRPIPDRIWRNIDRLGASVLIYHPHFVEGAKQVEYARALRRAIANKSVSPLIVFPHQGSQDYIFRITSGPGPEVAVSQKDRRRAEEALEHYFRFAEAQINPPFGFVDFPKQGDPVAAGSWGFGWALASSGIAQIRLSTEEGSVGDVAIGAPFPGVREAYPKYPEADQAGFGFVVPKLRPGTHVLYLTVVAKDGAESVLERWIRIRSAR